MTGAETLWDLLEAAADRFAGRIALHWGERHLTYGDLARDARRLAAGLRAWGLQPGQRALVALPSDPRFVVTLFGVLGAGGTVLRIDPAGRPAELAAAVRRFRPRLFISTAGVLSRLPGGMGGDTTALCPDGPPPDGALTWQGVLARGEGGRSLPRLDPDADAVALVTSGSVGEPKAAVLTHRALLAGVRQIVGGLAITEEDVGLSSLTLGPRIRLMLLAYLAVGAQVVLPTVLAPRTIVRLVERHRVTVLHLVVPMARLLVEVPLRRVPDASSLRLAYTAGSPLSEEIAEGFRRRFGHPLVQLYGSTEGGSFCINLRRPGEPRCAGQLFPEVETRLLGADGAETPQGHAGEGELLVRHEGVMSRYLEDPAATAAVLRDGWFHTGDLVRRDAEGNHWIVGRLKNVIRVADHNVHPEEVEEVIRRLPGVADAAVVGLMDPQRVEAPGALVCPARGAGLRPEDVLDHCWRHLAPYKVPREVVLVPRLPRGPSGKLLRAQLANLFADSVGAEARR